MTNGLAQVLSTAISAWMSWISSSFDSRSIWSWKLAQVIPDSGWWAHMFDGDDLTGSLFDSLVDDSKASTFGPS